jgi:ParB-like chromosome segregation protein Spo0J
MAKPGPDAAPEAIPQEYDPAVPLGRLTPHPANPNQGDSGLIGELLAANGFAGAVLAQKSTGLLIDGEHRWIAAGQQGMATIPVLWLDVDDDARDRLLASLNEATRRGRNDESKLVALLEGLAATPRGLAGAAFDGDDLDKLIADLNRPLQLDDAPTGARYAETEDELAAREARIAAYQDRKQGGALVEMILVFTPEEHAEATSLLAAVREADGDLPAAAVVLAALRALAAQRHQEEAPAQ